jgi:hypothetical protein
VDKDKMQERASGIVKEQTPVSEALDFNAELIMTIEKQVEILAARLEHVSSSEPRDGTKDDGPTGRGNSSLASRIHSQGNQLADISDRLNYVTRVLEV